MEITTRNRQVLAAIKKSHPSVSWLAFGVFVGALVVYGFTLAPGLLWGGGDFATFQTRLYTGQIEGGVFGHPLWVIVAHPFLWLPIRDVAWRANFAAAGFAAGALLFVFLSAQRLTRSPRASTFFADYSIWAIVNYLQVVEGAGPDVRLFELPGAGTGRQLPLILAQRGSGDLFLGDVNRYYDLSEIETVFTIVPAGPIYRLIPK